MLSTKTKNSNKYVVPKFNANIKFKLILGWFKYVDIDDLNNNKVRKIHLLHITPQLFFDTNSGKDIHIMTIPYMNKFNKTYIARLVYYLMCKKFKIFIVCITIIHHFKTQPL
jgi:hypothetical protein